MSCLSIPHFKEIKKMDFFHNIKCPLSNVNQFTEATYGFLIFILLVIKTIHIIGIKDGKKGNQIYFLQVIDQQHYQVSLTNSSIMIKPIHLEEQIKIALKLRYLCKNSYDASL